MDHFLRNCRDAFRNLYQLPNGTVDTSRRVIPASHFANARMHRVLGLLYAGLPNADFQFPHHEQDWRNAAYGQTLYTAKCTAEAEKLFDRLQSKLDLPVLIKGPALASQAWPDRGLRSFDDLDFRCGRHEIEALSSTMFDAGYMPEIDNATHRENLWHFGWGISFIRPDGLRIEVNHRLFPPHYAWPRHLQLNDRSLLADQFLDQSSVRTLSPELHLIYSCMHAAWHGWERLAWIVDIAGLLVRYPDAYDRAATHVSSAGFAYRTLNTGCRLAETIFGPLSDKTIDPDVKEEIITHALTILNRSTPGISAIQLRTCHRQLSSRREIATETLRRVLIPGDGDFKAFDLPGHWRWLYWLTRPVRGIFFAHT